MSETRPNVRFQPEWAEFSALSDLLAQAGCTEPDATSRAVFELLEDSAWLTRYEHVAKHEALLAAGKRLEGMAWEWHPDDEQRAAR